MPGLQPRHPRGGGAGLIAAGLPAACVQIVRTADRAAVGLILSGLDHAIDLIIPRGGKSLIARVQAEARARCWATWRA